MLSEEKIREKLEHQYNILALLKKEIDYCEHKWDRMILEIRIDFCNSKIDLLREILNG